MAGDLITPVIVQQLLLVDDLTGGQTKTFINVGVLWCKVEQNGGRESFTDEQLREVGDHTFTARWNDVVAYGINAGYRLLTSGELPGDPYFNVRSVQNVGLAGDAAKILAERGVIS